MPEEPAPPRGWIRVLAAIVGAVAAGVAGAAVMVLGCDDLECLGWVLALPVAALVGGALAFAVTLDLQRWRARRREADGVER